MENNGYQIEVSPFFSLNTYFILQKDGFYFMKTVAVVIGYIKRIFLLSSLSTDTTSASSSLSQA